MPELLLELGCEELPATFVQKAMDDLQAAIEAGLKEAGLEYKANRPPIGTPRRLIVSIEDIPIQQPDSMKEFRGPSLSGAFDASGNPTKALEGFCRGQGVEVGDVEQRDGYVWAIKKVDGRATAEVLQELLPKAIRSLTFEKTMRWGSGRMRFARPIRWILAVYDGKPISFDVEGIAANDESRGHRFYAPESFRATTYDELLDGLMARKVEPNPREREATIREVAVRMASGDVEMPESLVAENVFLTEWPTPIEGSFRESYLELPEPVLVTAMAKHEKMFPVRKGGKLTNKFIFVRNSGEDDVVRSGAEWVLNARFNDAKFFYDEDRKFTIEEFLNRTSAIVYQEKLGTIRQRADRLASLAEWIAEQTGGTGEEADFARQAGLYAKADLGTGLVSELASLQGIVGGEYAKRSGLPEAVCEGIANHYDLSKCGADTPGARTGMRLLLADQVDKLAGYLGIGEIPSGSSDPFGLRRAATYCIEGTWTNWNLDFAGLLGVAATLYATQGVEIDLDTVQQAAKSIFVGRYEALMGEHRYDVVAAAAMEDYGMAALQPFMVLYRAELLGRLAQDTAFVQSATRPLNILKAALEKGEDVPDSLEGCRTSLNSPEAERLATVLDSFAVEPGSHDAHIASLKALAEPINSFFDSTMVMSKDSSERRARLALVRAASEALLTAGDLAKLVIEGD